MRPWPLPERLTASESDWCLRANGLCARHRLRSLLATISWLGNGAFWYVAMAAMAIFGGRTGMFASLHLAATGVLALALYRRLKRWTRRPRPFAMDARIRAWTAPLDEFSFPSGHTMHAVAFTVITLAYYPYLAWLFIPFTACVAASRVLLGLHYPSDVLAAIAIGTGLASLSLWLMPGASLFS